MLKPPPREVWGDSSRQCPLFFLTADRSPFQPPEFSPRPPPSVRGVFVSLIVVVSACHLFPSLNAQRIRCCSTRGKTFCQPKGSSTPATAMTLSRHFLASRRDSAVEFSDYEAATSHERLPTRS